MKHLKGLYLIMRSTLFKPEHQQFQAFKKCEGKVGFSYCHEREVLGKNFVFLKFKCCFLLKLMTMKLNGQSILLKSRIYEWIDQNIDQIIRQSPELKKKFFGCSSCTHHDPNLIQYRKIKEMLRKHADKLINKLRMKWRESQIAQITYKLFSNEFNFKEKNNYIDFQIENCIQYYISIHTSGPTYDKQQYIKVKKKILEREYQKYLERNQETKDAAASKF